MKSFRFLDRRAGYSLSAMALLLGTIFPSLVPAFASADVLSSRSIAMAVSTADAAGVEYKVSFTPVATYKSIIIDWCSNSPVIGEDPCSLPTGFTAGTNPTVTFTTNSLGTLDKTGSTAGHTVIQGDGTTGAASATVFTIAGVHNPTAAGSFYARIYTYSVADPTAVYVDADTLGSPTDTGAVALSATLAIGVSAVVRETLTFCVSKSAPTAGCGGTDTPNLTLGHSSPAALDASQVDSDSANAQLSTNAASGATVKMKTNNACGGLHRFGAAGGTCDIPAAGSGAATSGGFTIPTSDIGGFGLSVGTPAAVGTGFGTLTAAAPYNGGAAKYGFYTTNVTGSYGDTIFSSTAPVGNMNVPLTYAAAAGTTTPAGLYTANLSLIATGTF